MDTLVGLLTDQPVDVLINVVGALGEFARIPANKASIHRCGGIKLLINLLRSTNEACGTFLQLRRHCSSLKHSPFPATEFINVSFYCLVSSRRCSLTSPRQWGAAPWI